MLKPDIVNKFTKECDLYLNEIYSNLPIGKTYLIEWDPDIVKDDRYRLFAIRVPGATRGCVYVDKETNLIEKIVFDEHCSFEEGIGCYDRKIVSLSRFWVGKELK